MRRLSRVRLTPLSFNTLPACSLWAPAVCQACVGTQRLPAGGAKTGSSVGASTELAGGGRDVRHCVRRRCLVSKPQYAGAVSPADVRGKRQRLYYGVRAAEHTGVRPAATHSPPWSWGRFCASHFSKMLNIISCSKQDGCCLIIQLLLACLIP